MATKQDGRTVLQSAALRELLSSSITNYASAEVAVLHIMEEYDFDLDLLQRILSGLSIVS